MRKHLIMLRKSKNLTQKDVASNLGISRPFYAMIESEKRNPNLDLAQQIAKYFNTDLEKIFFEDVCHESKQDIKPA